MKNGESYVGLIDFLDLTRQRWVNAWSNKTFRNTLLLGLVIILTASVTTDFFFTYIQNLKEGITLNDWVLKKIPAFDVSTPIVLIMVSAILLFHIRCATNPDMFVTLVWALIFQLIFRIVTIDATKFFAPPDLIVLKDPLGSILYHARFITRDLFYSGHTACLFVFYFCANKKYDKLYLLFASITIGSLLLIQHVHYTIDVVSAPFFAYTCVWISKRIMISRKVYVMAT